MDRVSDRHEGTLDGLLAPVDATRLATVAVTVSAAVASAPACQHTAWMLLNLLARQELIVGRVILDCPSGVPLAGRVVPLAPRHVDLQTALIHGATAIDAVPVAVTSDVPDDAIRLVVGPGPPIEGTIRVYGERWWGGISAGELLGSSIDSGLPFGPYAAACLAAAEVFKAVRLATPSTTATAFYSTWSLRAMDTPPTLAEDIGPDAVEDVEIDMALAGVGAVGSAWVHAMWATPGISGRAVLADADERGVDRTNLNRCPVFGAASVDHPKASEAARICADSLLTLVPHDGPIGEVEDRPPLIVSAVDTNTSRQAVQGLYPPRLLSASTHNLRAELLRCDPSAGAPCICCFNPPEADPADADLRRDFLAADEETRKRLAASVDLTVEEAERWAIDGTCSYATDRLLDQLRQTEDGPAAFAVGFVSVMAGTMLAAQTIREMGTGGILDGTMARAVMQFVDPLAATNAPRRLQRDASCSMCDPAAPATAIWRRRYDSGPRRASAFVPAPKA